MELHGILDRVLLNTSCSPLLFSWAAKTWSTARLLSRRMAAATRLPFTPGACSRLMQWGTILACSRCSRRSIAADEGVPPAYTDWLSWHVLKNGMQG